MPNTGAPWNIPYVAGTDLVSDWPTDSLALANAIADGLDEAKGLIAVKHVLKTDTFSASVASGAETAVTGLSITHTLADAANKLIITAYFGAAASSSQAASVGIAVADDGSLIGVGAAAGNRTQMAAGGRISVTGGSYIVNNMSVTFVYEPGDVSAHTYTVRAINHDNSTRTVYINQREGDTDVAPAPRTASAIVIQEVQV